MGVTVNRNISPILARGALANSNKPTLVDLAMENPTPWASIASLL